MCSTYSVGSTGTFSKKFAKLVTNSWPNLSKALSQKTKTKQDPTPPPLSASSTHHSTGKYTHNRPTLPSLSSVFRQAAGEVQMSNPKAGSFRTCSLSSAMAAQTPGYICLCLHHNHIFLALANHRQPSPGLDLFKPEEKAVSAPIQNSENKKSRLQRSTPWSIDFF